MNSADLAGALRAAHTDFEAADATSAWKRATGRAWGVLCGAAFLGARASVYLIAVACAALACVASPTAPVAFRSCVIQPKPAGL